jgi:hypothetical protein
MISNLLCDACQIRTLPKFALGCSAAVKRPKLKRRIGGIRAVHEKDGAKILPLPAKLAALAFLVAAAWDPTAPVVIEHGFLTGNDYLQKSETERHGYVMGLLDGLLALSRARAA